MAYRALKPMKVGDVTKEPGDLVPEAMEWNNLRAWLNEGYLEEIPDEEAAPAPKKPAAKRTSTKKKE